MENIFCPLDISKHLTAADLGALGQDDVIQFAFSGRHRTVNIFLVRRNQRKLGVFAMHLASKMPRPVMLYSENRRGGRREDFVAGRKR